MEPILPEPKVEAEPVLQAGESAPVSPLAGQVEVAPNVAPEKSQEAVAAPISPEAPVIASVDDPAASVTPQANPSVATVAQDDDLSADDVDVIEKEWVDKAKKIVSATKDDPHQQEKEVSKLQADYLMKRYGKQIKLTD